MRRVNRRAARAESAAELAKQCDEWNAAYPVGTLVEYHPIIDEEDYRLRKTRSKASILSGHTAVVWLEDERGCVALDACVPVAGV